MQAIPIPILTVYTYLASEGFLCQSQSATINSRVTPSFIADAIKHSIVPHPQPLFKGVNKVCRASLIGGSVNEKSPPLTREGFGCHSYFFLCVFLYSEGVILNFSLKRLRYVPREPTPQASKACSTLKLPSSSFSCIFSNFIFR